MNMKQQYDLRYQPSLFQNGALAQSSLVHYIKAHFVMTDGNKFYVVCFADGAKLEKSGFTLVK